MDILSVDTETTLIAIMREVFIQNEVDGLVNALNEERE